MPSLPSGPSPRLLGVLFVLSGLTSLVYEVLWLRGFAIVFGSTLHSMSCVLTAFMLGLAAGSGLAGRVLRRRPDLLRGRWLLAYGVLELVIGAYGLAFTAALFLLQERWLGLIAALGSDTTPLLMAAHFTIATVTLALPTVCMGATLPILSMSLEKDTDTGGLYAWNTFGAAAGSLLASFVLIYWLGCLGAAVVAASVNGALFFACVAFRGTDRRQEPSPTADDAGPVDDRFGLGTSLALAFFSGYAFFAFELVWNRCLGLLLGNRIYVTSVTLGLVLLCLGVGARWARRLLVAGRSPRRILVSGWALAAVSTALALAFAGPALRAESTFGRLAFVALLVIVPATAMALVFPLLLSAPVDAPGRGVHVGRIYALNTLGSVAGSLLTGYVTLGELGSGRVLALNALLLLVCVAFAAGRRRAVTGLAAAAGLLVLVQWNVKLSTVDPERAIVLEEDAHGIFSISPVGTSTELLSVRCNATELVYHYGSPATQFVQESQAHVPLAFAPGADRVVVIGSGYGITAGTFGLYEDVGRVDAVEILPLFVTHAERFAGKNHGYHRNPRVRVHVADGRHFLATAPESFQIVSINVSDPYLPGSSSLFSREFYALVSAKLAPGGIVCQHVFGADSASLVHGFRAFFPYLRAIPGYRNSVSLVGSREPLEVRHAARYAAHPAVRDLGAGADLETLLRVGDARLAALLTQPAAFENSDLHPALEFRRLPGLHLFFSNE